MICKNRLMVNTKLPLREKWTESVRSRPPESNFRGSGFGMLYPDGERTSSHIKHSFYYISSEGEIYIFVNGIYVNVNIQKP